MHSVLVISFLFLIFTQLSHKKIIFFLKIIEGVVGVGGSTFLLVTRNFCSPPDFIKFVKVWTRIWNNNHNMHLLLSSIVFSALENHQPDSRLRQVAHGSHLCRSVPLSNGEELKQKQNKYKIKKNGLKKHTHFYKHWMFILKIMPHFMNAIDDFSQKFPLQCINFAWALSQNSSLSKIHRFY